QFINNWTWTKIFGSRIGNLQIGYLPAVTFRLHIRSWILE
ncbi:hypothetical protein ACLKA6_003095, partial [Drosophila palustris]